MKTSRKPLSTMLMLAMLGGCINSNTSDSSQGWGDSSGASDDDDDDDNDDDDVGSDTEAADSDADGGDSSTPVDPRGSRPYTEPASDASPLPARVWRLTHLQYRKSVEDLVGVPVDIAEFAAEVDNGVFKNFAAVGFVNDALALDYFEVAKTVAAAVTEERLRAFSPSGALTQADAEGFAAALARQAFRRPATAEEIGGYMAVYDLAAELEPQDPSAPFRAIVRGVLSSPHFLYRAELGIPELSAHEVATLLSYSIIDAPPSPELRSAADRGALNSPEGIRDAVEALMAQSVAEATHQEFLHQWLELSYFDDVEKFEDTFPGFAAVRDDMERETENFLRMHGNLSGGTLTALLSTPVSAHTPALETFYQADPAGSPSQERLGILALGAVMAQHGKPNLSSPTLRGLFVRDRLLCQHVELPPGFNPPPLSETEARGEAKTTRELYELHASDPTCRACHALLDPIGFNLEAYDGAGRLRATENGVPIDTFGELVGTDVDGPIASAAELSLALSQSQWVAECMAIQAFRFYLGTMETSRGIDAIVEARRAAGPQVDLGALVAALVSSPSLRQRVRE